MTRANSWGLSDIDIIPDPNRAARLRHVSDLAFGTAREESRFRVNGKPAVGLVLFQEQGANLVRLGASLRERLLEVRAEVAPLGIDLVIGFDAAEQIEEQITRLGKLAGSGFLIALVVLYLFLRQWRAVAVVGIAVPMSLLAALALLFLSGQSINIITLMGLAIAIGLVVGTGSGSRFVHSSRTASLKGRLGSAGYHTNLF